jgi:tetratricopeptide (TPR) repeat protein
MKLPVHSLILHFLLLTGWTVSVNRAGAQAPGQLDSREETASFETRFVEGNILFHKEKYEEAIALYEDLLKEDRRNADIAFELAKSYQKMGKSPESLEAIERAIRYETNNVWFKLFKIALLEENARYLEAADVCQDLIAMTPDALAFYKRKADNLGKAGRYQDAARVFTDYEAIYGSEEEIHQRKYDLFLAASDIPNAAKEAEKLVEFQPGNTYYLYLLAAHYADLGLDDQAEMLLKKILSIDPSDARAGIALRQHRKETSDPLGYLNSLQPLFSSPDGDLDAKIRELIPYVQNFDARDTIMTMMLLQSCQKLKNSYPGEAKVHALSGDVFKLNLDYKEAITSYKEAVRLNKRVYSVFEELMYVQFTTGQFADLKKTAEEALDYYPNQVKSAIWYSLALIYTQNPARAMTELENALMMAAGNTETEGHIIAYQGLALLNQNKYKEATDYFQKAVKKSGGDIKVLSMALYHLSNHAQSRPDALSLAQSIRESGKTLHPEIIILMSRLQASGVNKGDVINSLKNTEQETMLSADGLEFKGDTLFLLGEKTQALSYWNQSIQSGGFKYRIEQKIKSGNVLQ